MDTRRPDPAVARGGGTRWGVPPAEGGGVAAASCLVNHDGELGPRKTEKLPYPHCPKAQTPRGAISCSEFPWDQELEEEKTPQGSPHPQGIPFAGGGAETQLSGFHFSVPEMAFLLKKKKKERKGGREEGDFSHCCPIGSSPWGWQSKCPGMGPRFLTSKGRKRAATRSSHQAHGGALAAPGACPAGGICQEGRWGRAGEAGGRRPLL